MHLRSLKVQTVTIHKADMRVRFEADETIWTENSHKYSLPEVSQLADSACFGCAAQWVDREWPFAETLLTAVP